MSVLDAVPQGKGYRKAITFFVYMAASTAFVIAATALAGQHARVLDTTLGYAIGALAGWGMRRAIETIES